MVKHLFIQPGFEKMLRMLELDSFPGVKAFRGHLVKNHRLRRDIIRFESAVPTPAGTSMFYLKRNLKPYFKHSVRSWFQHGEVRSAAREEWENNQIFQQAGFGVVPLVAWGDEIDPGGERFSFLITGAAQGESLPEFVFREKEPATRALVFRVLAEEVATMHSTGLGMPDLFSRHVFIRWDGSMPRFQFIDLARIRRGPVIPWEDRAEDLAALHTSTPEVAASLEERRTFLDGYCREMGAAERDVLAQMIQRRSDYLLGKEKHRRNFQRQRPSGV